MTWFGEMPITKLVDEKYSQLWDDFIFISNIVNELMGTEYVPTVIQKGFVMDWESVPFFRGKCHIGGLIHDYYSRKNSIPVVTKKQAADIYFEFLEYRKASWWRKYLKYWAVRTLPDFVYFHKLDVEWDGKS